MKIRVPLFDYIQLNCNGNAAEFGRSMGVGRNAVYRWINNGWIVIDNTLYLPKRDLPVLNGAKAKANAKEGEE